MTITVMLGIDYMNESYGGGVVWELRGARYWIAAISSSRRVRTAVAGVRGAVRRAMRADSAAENGACDAGASAWRAHRPPAAISASRASTGSVADRRP
jgi:hypothetical protein